jgi:hypothetical protein
MTTIDEKTTCCAVCGEMSTRVILGSSNTVEPPDFDTRPGEMLRSTIGFWVVECPHCGYAAPDLEERPEGVSGIVRSEAYLAKQGPFLRHAYILEQLGHFAEAGWTALHAAWSADDSGDDASARACRTLAIALWKRGKAARQNFMNNPHEEFALAADVARRMGAFEEALATAKAGREGDDLPPLIEDLLRMELTFIQNRDTACHSLAELPERPAGTQRVTLQ